MFVIASTKVSGFAGSNACQSKLSQLDELADEPEERFLDRIQLLRRLIGRRVEHRQLLHLAQRDAAHNLPVDRIRIGPLAEQVVILGRRLAADRAAQAGRVALLLRRNVADSVRGG